MVGADSLPLPLPEPEPDPECSVPPELVVDVGVYVLYDVSEKVVVLEEPEDE